MKTRLKHILQIQFNDNEGLGKITHLMVWSPVDHCWYFEDYFEQDFLKTNKKYLKFLLNQEVVRIGLRNDTLDTIAVFLKDYGKERNRRFRKKFKR